MHFTRLRLTGFKSFVEATEFHVQPGLTGVVGPNGCGKSNLVEALRWVMGETSAKSLRGGEMDDVIFSGTAERPARNIAEVALVVDNADRNAPAGFNETDTLEIVRRIERGEGSAYKVNGREMRARDVQLLFADAASGARSAALVSQGKVGDIINAKPTARRHLLEEAAGITGLHSRRHEAELKLRAAEANLTRVDDVIAALEEQLRGLKRQARQATRYRNLSDHIRRAEALLLHLEWTQSTEARAAAEAALAEAVAALNETTGVVARLSAEQADAAARVPDLRHADAEAAAGLQRLLVARDALDAEEKRIEAARADVAQRLEQLAADRAREDALRADAVAAIERLEAERATLEGSQAEEEAERARRETELTALKQEVAGQQQAVSELTRAVAAEEARGVALARRVGDLDSRRGRLVSRQNEVAAEQERLREQAMSDEAVVALTQKVAEHKAAMEAARAAFDAAERGRTEADATLAQARERTQAEDAAATKLRAEASALSELLEVGDPDLWPPLIDSVTVAPGWEIALGAALGDDLTAPSDEAAPVHWRTVPPSGTDAALPDGAEPLAAHVQAPPALVRRLAHIGVVADAEAGRALADRLAPGQRLVTRDGALWRWDGFTIAAGTPTAAATRLAHRNRLNALRLSLAEAEARVAAEKATLEEANNARHAAFDAERGARETVRAAERALEAARVEETRTLAKVAEMRSRANALAETAENLARDLAEIDAQLAAAREEAAGLPDIAERKRTVAAHEQALAQRRVVLMESQSAFDRIAREVEIRRNRLIAIFNELNSWRQRATAAEGKAAEIDARRATATAESERLAALPAEIARQRASLFDAIAVAEAKRKETSDALVAAEQAVEASTRALKAAEATLSDQREERVRREGAVQQIDHTRALLVERIRERLDCAPDGALAAAGLDADQATGDKAAMQARLDKLVRERDTMGPVNLRAEAEATELEEKLTELQTERGDLIAAIARLRQGIGSLNREGRERLLAAFKTVDENFQALFGRLFGGGHAHLALTEAEDPLDAGLEIMASPPGKKLQSLSLLSGGEQALTALSLLFAVFISNPAPVCVLDEVDAPLDDANVDRYCTLLHEIAAETGTRFVLITHHRLTMARMDRLFGVTMAERGVSQLVSVDLQTAEALRATA
ncbi:MAG: chromosome segregation protein SMC [Rhodospirillales bacterium]